MILVLYAKSKRPITITVTGECQSDNRTKFGDEDSEVARLTGLLDYEEVVK